MELKQAKYPQNDCVQKPEKKLSHNQNSKHLTIISEMLNIVLNLIKIILIVMNNF